MQSSSPTSLEGMSYVPPDTSPDAPPPPGASEINSPAARLLALLHDGDRCLAEAQILHRRSVKMKEILRTEGQSLVDGFILMRAQVDVVGDLLAWLWGQNMGYLSRLEALLSQDKSFQQIDEICKQLEATQVDAELVAGEEGHTLYDFVDDTSVSSLKLEAQVALKEMLALHDKGLSSQLMLEERQLYFRQVVGAIHEALGCPPSPEGVPASLDGYALWRAIEHNVGQQEETVEHMKAALLTAASAYSRLTRGSREVGPGPSEAAALASSSSAAENERTLLQSLQSSMERMKGLQLAVDRFPHSVGKLRQMMRALLTDLERFHPEAGERVAAIKGDQARFAELAESVQSLLQELVSLAAFYHGFMSAYSQLGAEVNRRRRALERVAQVVEEATAKLDALHDEEEAERAEFYKEHGRFLPSSLCPVIQEAPARMHILPSVKELLDGLPKVQSG